MRIEPQKIHSVEMLVNLKARRRKGEGHEVVVFKKGTIYREGKIPGEVLQQAVRGCLDTVKVVLKSDLPPVSEPPSAEIVEPGDSRDTIVDSVERKATLRVRRSKK